MNASANEPQEKSAARNHKHVGRISTVTTFVVLATIALIVYELQTVLLPFVIAGLVAYICTPLLDHLARRTRLARQLYAVLAFLALLGVGAGFGLLGIPPLVREFARVATDFQGMIEMIARHALGDQTINVLGQPMNAAQIAQAATNGLRNWLGQTGRLAEFSAISFASFFGMIVTLVLLFYFLLSGPAIGRGLLRIVPPQERPLIRHIWSILDPVLRRYFIGVIIVVAYAAIAAYIGLALFLHIPHAVFLALLTGILEIIPVVGPGSSAVIAGLVAIQHATGLGSIIAYAVYATALRLSIDQFFGPLALGTAARLHPTLIIFCFLAGGVLFGIVGVVMSVPVALAVKTTIAVLYDEPPLPTSNH